MGRVSGLSWGTPGEWMYRDPLRHELVDHFPTSPMIVATGILESYPACQVFQAAHSHTWPKMTRFILPWSQHEGPGEGQTE